MGAVQQSSHNGLEPHQLVDVKHSRFMPVGEEMVDKGKVVRVIEIPEFQRLENWEVQLQELKICEDEENKAVLVSNVYFRTQKEVDLYLGILLSLKQLCNISIYTQIDTHQQKNLFCLTTRQNIICGYSQLNKSQLMGPTINKFLDLLIFVSKVVAGTKNMYVPPEEIVVDGSGEFLVRGFYYKEHDKSKLLLNYIAWVYEEFQNFGELFQNQQIISFIDFDIYLREVFLSLKNRKIPEEMLTEYLTKVKEKYNYLNYNFDSFQACCRSKRSRANRIERRQWLLTKKQNEIYFFNVKDRHLCQGRIIRKKRKIMVDNCHILFNKEQLQINMMLEGTKNMVKTSQFQLSDCFTISDIEIKYKFPFKLKNPLMFMQGRQIYLYDGAIYRYSIDQNKLFQESKKVTDCLCLVNSEELSYLAVRLSIDIFRHGIRIYHKDKYDILLPSGNPSLSSQIQNIKIDLKHVEFCVQVFKGVYVMLASHNLWILDTNFMCFFSFATVGQLKQYFKTKTIQDEQFAFDIINQPFPVKWLGQQDSLNLSIQGQTLHILGTVMGKLFYLEYQFILQAGMLKLKSYQPLFREEELKHGIKEEVSQQLKEFKFNIYTQNFDYFKTNRWTYKGPIFLQVLSLNSRTGKGHTQIILQTEQVLGSIKELIQQKRKKGQKWTKFHKSLLLYNITNIFNELSKNSISHKHFSINNLWITKNKKIKLTGWSQPHRNWYISDYRDYLLVCFNVITQNCSEKITDRLMDKHDKELSEFAVLREKMNLSLKHKHAEKKPDNEKHYINIRQSLHKVIYPIVEEYKADRQIFSFQFNTPRFSMLDIDEHKIKKMVAVVQGNHTNQQFTFKSTDSYTWNEQQSKLYIFTVNYQMLEASINVKQFKDETVVLEEYQYPPQNLVDCSFIYTPKGLFAFGGVARCSKKKILFNLQIYHFSKDKLTWQPVAQLKESRLNPKLTLSSSQNYVYLMGGDLDFGPNHLEVVTFNIHTNQVQTWVDQSYANPFQRINVRQTHKIFQISQEQNMFVLWVANSNNYYFQIFSNLVGGMDYQMEGKIYLEDYGEMPSVSISLVDGAIHFLRPYGKYTKISMGNLETASVMHKTLYSTN